MFFHAFHLQRNKPKGEAVDKFGWVSLKQNQRLFDMFEESVRGFKDRYFCVRPFNSTAWQSVVYWVPAKDPSGAVMMGLDGMLVMEDYSRFRFRFIWWSSFALGDTYCNYPIFSLHAQVHLLLFQELVTMNFFVWHFLSFVIFMLDFKLFGQWFTTEKRFLSVVANPVNLVFVIANLVAAQFVTEIGWNEFAISMFSLGMTHYLILFVMLYQRLTGAFLVSSKMLFFLFVPFYFSACAEYAHEVKSLMASGLMLLIYVLQQGWIVDYASRMLTVKKQPVVTEQKLDPHYQMQKGFNVKIELLAAVLSPMLDQRILHERIPTKEALWHRGVITDPHQ
ncbi:hypothetical protein TSUD_61870 [Trifolium subterraneum]|uniref:Uncharacterized protein n=1 Tax=Trifolium subterraneum TaxID=3900 RepID=A0A2Z6P7D3_TRISU|nr:hypothetical protein TSUD_61870 [Trifolium subterraneum]